MSVNVFCMAKRTGIGVLTVTELPDEQLRISAIHMLEENKFKTVDVVLSTEGALALLQILDAFKRSRAK